MFLIHALLPLAAHVKKSRHKHQEDVAHATGPEKKGSEQQRAGSVGLHPRIHHQVGWVEREQLCLAEENTSGHTDVIRVGWLVLEEKHSNLCSFSDH